MMKRIKGCRYGNSDCTFRKKQTCVALSDTYFEDSKCHFYKEDINGENLYDLDREIKRKHLPKDEALRRADLYISRRGKH